MKRALRRVAFALVLVVLAMAPATVSPATARDALTPAELARMLNKAFVNVAETVSPAVVVIRVAQHPDSQQFEMDETHPWFEMLPEEFRKRLNEQRERRRKKAEEKPEGEAEPAPDEQREPVFNGQGSGLIIRKDGYILTNRHVVEEAEKIKVRLKDGTEFNAVLRGTDPQSDLAVLKIEPGAYDLVAARFADSSKVRVGEFAIAIGAPLELDYSVTYGHISATGRSRIIDDPSMDQDFLQTDANINPGNSGGPLVNIEGEVTGINTLIKGMRTGIGFAIPSNLARDVAEQLIATGKFNRAYLGVRIRGMRESNEYRETIDGVKDGVVVFAIPPSGPAAKSDLKAGDVILAVDGRPVTTAQELKSEVRGKKIGSSVTLDVHRFGRNLKIGIKPEAWPGQAAPEIPQRVAQARSKPMAFGLKVEKVTEELAEKYNVEKSDGLMVVEIEPHSLAERKDIRLGDIITQVNQKPVTSVKQFNEALKNAGTEKGVVLQFLSQGTRRFEILRESRD